MSIIRLILAPGEARIVGSLRKEVKFDVVTQWVKVPPEQRVAASSVAKSAGKPGNGSLEPDGARVQAVY